MLKFPKMVPNKVYRIMNQYTLPYNEKNQLKGNLIAVYGESINDTAEFFDNPFWQFRRYNRYCIERRLNTTIFGKTLRIKNDTENIFMSSMGVKHPNLLVATTPTMCRGMNVIYELNQYMDYVNKNERIANKSIQQQMSIKMNLFIDRLKYVSDKFSAYDKKYLMIPVDKYIMNTKSISIWSNRKYLFNPVIQLIRTIGTNPSMFRQLSDWTFVFNNLNEVYIVECKDIDSDTFENIKKAFTKFRSRPNNISSEELDDIGLGDTEDENEENINEVNKNTLVSATSSMIKTVNSLPLEDKEKMLLKTDIVADTKKVYKANSNNPIGEIPKETIEKEIPSSEKEKITNISITDKEEIKDELTNSRLTSDNRLVTKDELDDIAAKKIKTALNKKILPPQQSIQRLARIEKIQKEMKELKVDDKTTIEDLAVKAKMKSIDDNKINVDVINENVKNIPFNNFEKGYNEKLLDYDLTNILMSFSKKDRPLYLISFEKEDVSTATDKLYNIRAVFEDEKGTRHTLNFDIPKFVDNKFIHINGSDKLFINQIIPLPVTKVSPDEVQVSSNYNKVFIQRFGKNVSNKISKFHKIVPELKHSAFTYTKGNNIQENTAYMTTIEYDELSSKYSTIDLVNHNITIMFNQPEIRRIADNYDLKFDNDSEIPFAIETLKNGEYKLITLDINTDTISGTELSPIDYIIEKLSDDIPSFKTEFSKTSVGKKYMYSRATIMAKKVPMLLLLSFLEGLEPLLNRINADYTFTETRPQLKENSIEKSVVQFRDGYLVYKNTPFSNALLLNALHDLPTEEYDFIDFSSKDIYYDIFTKLFGRRNIGNAFENFNQLFVDPITKEILEDYNLPTNFIDLMIYANSLLENNTYDLDGDMKNYRIRSNELLNAHVYKILTKAYENYRVTADNKNPTKFSIKKMDVINDMFNSQVLEEYSTLNPIYEMDRMRATSYKGPGGCNIDRAFNIEKRAYNETMLGVLAQSSPISSSVGVARIMALNPNITSLRGYINPGSQNKINSLNMTNMLSTAEMLVPMTATHDDAQRVSMASTQSRHTIATMDSDSPLFGYGIDKVLAKTISNKFAYKADEDGTVIEKNDKLGYMMIEYKSGKRQVIDLTDKQALNTGSGFYINNKLSPVIEVGKKFKAGDVLAVNKDFFRYDELTGDITYTSGPLARVAVVHGSCVFEDSTLVTERLAERLSSKIVEQKQIAIGKNASIYKMAKIGDYVKVGDPLLVFDESYQDEYLNKLLAKMNEDDKEDIINAGKTPVKSKVNGTIIGLKIYYITPKEELSESLQAIIKEYEKPIKERIKIFENSGLNIKDLTSLNDLPQETKPQISGKDAKVKGVKMNDNSVLIEFYIQSIDKFSVGDKLTYSTALKGINQSLIPLGKEPYLASDHNEKIDCLMSVSGYYSRMTNSFALSLAINNMMLGAEKKIKDILEK